MDVTTTIGKQEDGRIDGQGIRLLRGFADTLEYEAKPLGSRMRIRFFNATAGSSNS